MLPLSRETGSRRTPTKWTATLVISVVASGLYLAVGFVGATVFGPSFSGGSYPLSFGLSLLTVGLPVVLWSRYGLWWPLVVLAAVLTFWHGLVGVLGGEGDGTPIFGLVLAGAPVYVGIYAVVSGLERLLPTVVERYRS